MKKMKTESLNAFINAIGMTDQELTQWFKSRQISGQCIGTKLIFPIVYKNGNNFEIYPELIPERKDEIWGYEITPGVVISKNSEKISYHDALALAKKSVMNGRYGDLPSFEWVRRNLTATVLQKMANMDDLLMKNGIEAVTCVGSIWVQYYYVDLDCVRSCWYSEETRKVRQIISF